MAARRGKSQARRSGGGSNGLPGWAWLVIGVLLAIVVILAAPKFMSKDGQGGFFRIGAPHADPNAQPQGSSQADEAFEPVAAESSPDATSTKPTEANKDGDFDFYELLPGEEVAMTDAQIAAIAKEEARRKAAEAVAATDAATQAADAQARAVAAAAGLPQPLPESGSTPPSPRPTQVASAAPTKPEAAPQPSTTPASTPSKPANATPYILQAGAFQASGDAEAVKARVALLGLNARVESTTINGKTMYRVRMGPYASASELAEAKSKLSSGGLPAVAIKAK